jgi:ATP-binding cassette subfamily B protein
MGQLLRLQRITSDMEPGILNRQFIGTAALLAGGLVLLAAVLRGVFLFFTRQTLIIMSRYVEFEQKNLLYQQYQSLSLSFFRTHSTGDMMSRITEDVSKVRMYTGPGIMYTINTITLFIMVIVTMLWVNVELTLYAILPLPLLCFAIYKVESLVTRKSTQIQEKLADLTAFTQETFSGIRSVKSYVREDAVTEVFNRQSGEYRDRSMELVKINALFFPSIILLIGMSTIFTFWIGGEQIIKGVLSVGNIAEFIIYVNLLTWPVASLGWVTTLIQQAGASQKRINTFMDAKSEITSPLEGAELDPHAGISLSFKQVSFTYPVTGIKALQAVSFEIHSGKTLAIVGKTGSGKSSLANHILRMFDPQQGEILINQKPITEYKLESLRKAIGYVPQDVLLFSDTIMANISFGKPSASMAEIEAAAKFAAVEDNILSFPEQYNTIVGEKGVMLSGGQKQRVSLARAIIKSPGLLILDDALSAVDTKTEEDILNALQQRQQLPDPPTVLLISHRISTVKSADLILVMDHGKIIETGTHSELLALQGDYAELYRKQLLEAEKDSPFAEFEVTEA